MKTRRHDARRILGLVAAVVLCGSTSAFACPMCFGAQETTLVGGTKLGVLALLLVLLAVQGGFVAFFLYLRRRAKRIAELDIDIEWSELQGGAK